MITKIAKLVAGWLTKEGVISENDSELYEYAMYSFLFGTLPILIAVIWGIILGMLVESILFMLPFILIRKFSGGYHLKSPVCCFVTSVSLVGGALIILRYVVQRSLLVPLTVVVALAGILLCILLPVLMVLVGCIGFFASYMTTRSRQKEFAVMRCLGMNQRKIFSIVFFEQTVLAMLGGGAGTGIGWVMDGVMESGALIKAGLVIAVFLIGAAIATIRVTSVNVMKLMKVED